MSALNFQGLVTFGVSEQGKYVFSLVCGVEQSGRKLTTFRRNLLPPPAIQKGDPEVRGRRFLLNTGSLLPEHTSSHLIQR